MSASDKDKPPTKNVVVTRAKGKSKTSADAGNSRVDKSCDSDASVTRTSRTLGRQYMSDAAMGGPDTDRETSCAEPVPQEEPASGLDETLRPERPFEICVNEAQGDAMRIFCISGVYLYVEATGVQPGSTARVMSPLFPPKYHTEDKCLHFFFSMHGVHMGTMRLWDARTLYKFFEHVGSKCVYSIFILITVTGIFSCQLFLALALYALILFYNLWLLHVLPF